MNFYRIDKDKVVSSIAVVPSEVSLVFAIDVYDLYSSFGMARTALDIAHHVAESVPAEPIFIHADRDNVEEFLCEAPSALAVGINLPTSVKYKSTFPDSDRLITIGANDFFPYPDAHACDIVLSPFFNPVKFPISGGWPRQQTVINFTAAPTRIRMSSDEMPENPKVIACYIRHVESEVLGKLLVKFRRLNEKHGCQFLISTGHATHDDAAQLIKNFSERYLPDLEFFWFKKEMYNHNGKASNPYEEFLRRAHAIVITHDTLSLSDAVATGRPVFLHTNVHHAHNLLREKNTEHGRNGQYIAEQNYLLQQALIREGRLKLFTEKNMLSGWRPKYRDEWRLIGNQIANVARERRIALTRHQQFPKLCS